MSYTQLTWLVLGAGLVAAFTCALLHRIVHHDTFRRYHEVGYAVFLQLGVIFAVLLAFVFNNVWSDYNIASQAINRECASLHGIAILSDRLPSPARDAILGDLHTYLTTVLDREWPDMQRRNESQAASAKFQSLWQTVETVDTTRPDNQVRGELLSLLTAAHQSRETRLFQMKQSVPGLIWSVLILFASGLTGCMLAFAAEESISKSVLVGIFTSALTLALLTVHVLDFPFESALQLPSRDFNETLEKVDDLIAAAAAWCTRVRVSHDVGASRTPCARGDQVAEWPRAVGDGRTAMTSMRFAEGQVLFREGDQSDSVFRLLNGAVDVVRELDGAPILLGIVGAGEFIGEMGVVENRPRSATARAASEVEVEILTPAEFFDQIAASPPAARELIQRLSQRLREADDRIVNDERRDSRSLRNRAEAVGASAGKAYLGAKNPWLQAQLHTPVAVGELPFIVGRAPLAEEEQPLLQPDLKLDDIPPFRLSRNHFMIERRNGGYHVRDLRSMLGTIVNGQPIGHHFRTDDAPLRPGENEIIAGGADSSFVFSVFVD